MANATPGQIKALHIVIKKLGIDKDHYTEILSTYNVTSSKNLSSKDAHELLTMLIDQAQKLGIWHKMAQDISRPGMASKGQLAAIKAKWRDVSRAAPEKQADALNVFIRNSTGISTINWLTKDAAKKMLIILTQMERQKEASHG